MTGPTHRAVGTVTAAGFCAATGLAPMAWAVVIATAYATSRLPDRAEKPLGLDHRTVTHWPLLALTLAAAVALLVPWATDEISDGRLDVAPIAVLVAIGFAIGTVMHILGDAMTLGGVPLAGPFSRKDRWIVPRAWRFRVYETETLLEPRPWQWGRRRPRVQRRTPSKADTAIRLAATAATVLIVAVHAIGLQTLMRLAISA